MSTTDIQGLFDRLEILATPQRMEIAEILLERPQHVSADQIIERLRHSGSNVSKATVYNSLKLFVEKGLVNELTVDPERKFYDSTTRAHHHFYNVDSGELINIPEDAIKLDRLPDLPAGTEQCGVEVLIRIRNAD